MQHHNNNMLSFLLKKTTKTIHISIKCKQIYFNMHISFIKKRNMKNTNKILRKERECKKDTEKELNIKLPDENKRYFI